MGNTHADTAQYELARSLAAAGAPEKALSILGDGPHPPAWAPLVRQVTYTVAAALRDGAVPSDPMAPVVTRVLRSPSYRASEIEAARGEIAAIFDPYAAEPPRDTVVDAGRAFVIAMTPRSGSTFLVRCLRELGLFGRPDEYLNRFEPSGMPRFVADLRAPTLDAYVQGISTQTRSANDLFGIKVDPTMLLPLLIEGTFDRILANARFIYTTREDVVMQAISFSRAQITGAWTSQTAPIKTPEFDFAHLYGNVLHLTEMMARWETFFAMNDIRPLRLTYEAIDRDVDTVIGRIADFLEVKLPGPPGFRASNTARQRDDLSFAWRKQFLEALGTMP